jgi:hypothetical protein
MSVLSRVLSEALGGLRVLVATPTLEMTGIVTFTATLGLRAADFSSLLQSRVTAALYNTIGDPTLITTKQIFITEIHEVSSRRIMIQTQITVQMDTDPSHDYSVACPIFPELRQQLNSACADTRSCNCTISTIEAEENPLLCSSYGYYKSPFRNAVVNCIRRDCGEYQFLLVIFLLFCGGVLGGAFLCCNNGCSFRPKEDDDEKSEGQALQEQAENVSSMVARDHAAADESSADESDSDDSDKYPTEVDLTDGIDEGEIGIIAQLALNHFYQSALQGSEGEARKAKQRVATGAAAVSLLKKLGLKLLLVVPLVLQKNWIPVFFFMIDIAVLIYCGCSGAYCPGSLYNEVHVLVAGKRFVRRFRWKRFSLWMKFFVGFQVSLRMVGTFNKRTFDA